MMQLLYCAGEEELVQEFTMTGLLPDTEEFITYEGSLTQPPCQVYFPLLLVPDWGMNRETIEKGNSLCRQSATLFVDSRQLSLPGNGRAYT
jgi:carbonic anhydrase